MHIILTHEQADFDALASLLGAYLLDDTAYPVLPNRMNRNVSAFLTLYGTELPFLDRRDLPSEPVDSVVLVDTQSLVTVKGTGPKTRVRVVDHHTPKDNLPASWTVSIDETGANATLFVEALREQRTPLSMIQATLLLLGIYEDTGSLTYSRTTPRDLQAAGYLLEQEANLSIAAHFLNHPLSTKQQDLYERMRTSLQTHQIHGNQILIACGEAHEMDEELSTIAHKLRDLLDPDALFMLVSLRGGVQMIARSTSDGIDVAEIVSVFGGGGHSRAAAGLIKDRSLDEVRDELLEILPAYVRPSITVSQIMSHGAQVLTPDTPAEEAARRMQRYGYEGYPVVKQGKVVGLLTRRAVDRSIAHKLNLPAASLMDAGEVTIFPSNSIEELQRKMTDTGWGQIPVVHPETGTIIGIVTRTDVLKTLQQKTGPTDRQNLAEKLESALPPARLDLLKKIAAEAHELRCALYIVGGFVRDLLLERPSLDFDLVVEGDAITLTKALARKYGGRVTSHARFGTAKWFLEDHEASQELLGSDPAERWVVEEEDAGDDDLPDNVDLISARTEFYTHPTALPTVERGSIKLDLHRRDFTINTLAVRLDGSHYGELYDYWGGLSDLREGLVRCLHSLSFVDDPTRILRAIRFEQRFDFRIEARTLELLEEADPLLERVSGDRIRHELDHILDEEHAAQMMARLAKLNVFTVIHPGLVWDDWIHQRVETLSQISRKSRKDSPELGAFFELLSERKPGQLFRWLGYMLWFIRPGSDLVGGALRRLKVPRELANEVWSARALLDAVTELAGHSPSTITTRLDEFSPLSLAAGYLAVEEEQDRRLILRYVREWRNLRPVVDGHHLQALGLPPGPIYREILGELRAAWLDEKISSPDEEEVLLKALLEQAQVEEKSGQNQMKTTGTEE